ncbi:MAG: nucleotide pyrophosphohydrolase [Methanobacteriota archaeon]
MPLDNEKTVGNLKEAIKKFRDERDWGKYHKPKDLALSISIEAAELLELFQWKSEDEIDELLKDPKYFASVEKELADVINYCFALSNALDIDISKALLDKIEISSRNYPIKKTKGKYKKYTEL